MTHRKFAASVLHNGSPIAQNLSLCINDFNFVTIPSGIVEVDTDFRASRVTESNNKLCMLLSKVYNNNYTFTAEDYILNKDDKKLNKFVKYNFKYQYCFLSSEIDKAINVIRMASRYPFVAYVHSGNLVSEGHSVIDSVVLGILDETGYLIGSRRDIDQ